MSGLANMFRKDLKIILKDYKVLFLLFILPILTILIFSVGLSPLLEHNAFIEPFRIVLVDNEGSAWTSLLATQLRNLEVVDKVIFADEEEARRLIENQELAAAIIIPENLSESIDYWAPQAGRVMGSNLLYLQSRLVKNIAYVGSETVSSGLASLNVIYNIEAANGYAAEDIYKEIGRAFEAFINIVLNRKAIISEERFYNSDTNPVIFYAFSLLSIFIMYSSIPCMKLLTDERQLGILSRLNTTPVKSRVTVASKLMVSFLISVAQFLVIMILAIIVEGGSMITKLGTMVPVFIATSLASGAFSILIAGISSSGSAADLIANLSILLMAVAGGSLYPLSSLPASCRQLSVLTINRWSTQGLLNALNEGNPAAILESTGALIILALLYLTGASLILSLKRRRMAG
ncbi:MAG: ABC transporter permease [Acetivibrionales bacterium]|jgi:ABC-2 type transport system permease protein